MTTATATRTVAIQHFVPESDRAALMLSALQRTTPDGCRLQRTDADWLFLWGPGAPNRFGPMAAQIARGGHVIALDLSYWHREAKVRIAIDAAHPQAWLLRRDWPTTRLRADRVPVADRWNPRGPVIVAGLGEKATVQYGAATVADWEAAMIREAHARGREVRYRPKRGTAHPLGTTLASSNDIDQALHGASLVITWHSNVAVDAIRNGIPVLCKDGAAAAVYGSTWPTSGLPSPIDARLRDRVLANLAWFQWAPSEAAGLWAFLEELLS